MKRSAQQEDAATASVIPSSGTFMRLLKLGKPYIDWYVMLCLLAAVISLTTVGMAECLRRIINAATNQDMTGLAAAAVLAITIAVADVAASFVKNYLTGVLEYKSTSRLQIALLDKLLHSQIKELDRYHSADLISRINDSAPAAQQGINNKTIELFSNVMQILFLLTYLLSLQYVLTIGTILICALVPLVMIPFTARMRALHQQRQEVETAQQMFIQDTVQGAEVVRAFSLAPQLNRKFTERVNQFFKIHLPVSRLEAVGYNLPFAVVLGGLLYLLSYGGYLVIDGRLDVGAVAAFLICFEQLTNPVSKLANLWTELQSSLAQGNRLFEMLDLKTEDERQAGDTQDLRHVEQSGLSVLTITFNNVSFNYNRDPVLQNICLTIAPGKVTALAGPSGSGKSTLLHLLLGEYEPAEGSIECGGVPLSSIPPRLWRGSLAYVSQEPYLFSGTLYENIAWGRSGATHEEVIKAAQKAGIHEFIMSTPLQYETAIGERGLTLSGGERQRLSIARAFIREPRLLLLDEPTAALDSHNEQIVQHALQELMRDRTTMVIAHRLSTIREADQIYFMEAGTVMEEGTHEKLMAMEGKYYTMVEASAKSEVIPAAAGEVSL
ncbi:hypothetical protein C2I18_01090 [Paenibacillus sp. PK3_47]|uniref:ABC transporter ATP-binding protein n=1 Tax=Paenibacillus sp. PK3_47 TaxID=2072642 RepID=UPI00201D8A16|nr:ABC transporter ATP-binding protein [Paenibacillus sp. PK3_47]UQZ32262.1 hypothetical protein C2I18_01090 [Paenibacillus sp. PK3_47]